MEKFYKLDENTRRTIFNQVAVQYGIPPVAVEKDWWVTLLLKTIFVSPYSKHIVFKGGTSLSKGYKLIDRFSEDIDLAINRTFFGFKNDLNRSQITRLRKASCDFLSNDFSNYLSEKLYEIKINGFKIVVLPFEDSDTDPINIEIQYPSLTEQSEYILPRVLLEVSSRAPMEPVELRPIQTHVAEILPQLEFADTPMDIPIVLPKRTFLEKAFLLHEEYQRPAEKIKLGRKSRHLYDLEKMMDTEHGETALNDLPLYESIILHRKKFTRVGGVDYTTHFPDKINFIPTNGNKEMLEVDYNVMRENMIYGESLDFKDLIGRIEELQSRFRTIKI